MSSIEESRKSNVIDAAAAALGNVVSATINANRVRFMKRSRMCCDLYRTFDLRATKKMSVQEIFFGLQCEVADGMTKANKRDVVNREADKRRSLKPRF